MPKQITVSFMMLVCRIILTDTISLFYNIRLTEILRGNNCTMVFVWNWRKELSIMKSMKII